MPNKQVKILVIDDEADFSFFLKKNLERFAYQVLVASDGKEGIKLARRHKPNLIFLDIMMPGIDGFEVLETLKSDKDTLSIPVIMLSGRDDQEAQAKAASLYDEAYLIKPVEVEELHSRIEQVLGCRGQQ